MCEIGKWRKRAVEIEAIQIETVDDIGRVWDDCAIENGKKSLRVYDRLHDSWIEFEFGDWVIRGVHGEYFPINSEVFLATYRQLNDRTRDIVEDVRAEMDRQVILWGPQSHPSDRGCANEHFVMGESIMKRMVDELSNRGELTWADIAMEELAEALDETDPKKKVVELIQLAAVVGSWINCVQSAVEYNEGQAE